MTKGFLLLALGAPEYGQWARNMAISLKYHNDLPITLVHDTKAITGIDLKEQYNGVLYDDIKVMEPEDYKLDGRFAPGFAKTNLYKYTDYEQTIYVDVDGLCVNNVDTLLEKAKGMPFCSHVWNYGKKTDKDWGWEMMWSTPENVWEHFELKDDAEYPFLNSSLIIFTEDGFDVFEMASDMMENKPMPVQMHKIKWGKSNQPDELYFNAACAIYNLKPDIGQRPIYFRAPKILGPATVIDTLKDYWFLGCWGDKMMNHNSVYKVYDQLMMKYLMAGNNMAFNKAHQLMNRKFIKTN